jgi:hypothetical protein
LQTAQRLELKMEMTSATDDIEFKDRFEAGDFPPSDFRHRDHLRLAFVYLCECDVQSTNNQMRTALRNFLKCNNVPADKYHETVTYSWVQAVKHFMEQAEPATSFEEFIAANERLLDTDIMLSHYKRETLFSDEARTKFVQPDLAAIPQYP